MILFHPHLINTPQAYGGWFEWFYGFILIFGFIEPFIRFYLFKKITNIQIPWWMYILNIFISVIFINTLLQLVIPFIYAFFIYFFITNRQVNYTYIVTGMIIVFGFLGMVTGTIAPVISLIYSSFSPTTLYTFNNYGTPFIELIEFAIALLIINRIKQPLNQYMTKVIAQSPLITWLFNIFLLSLAVIRAFYGSNLRGFLTTPVYVLINLSYLIITILLINLITRFFYYKNLTLNQATELTNLQTYTSHIEAMYDDLRRFRHDYKNILLSLKGAIQADDISEVRDVFNRVIQPTNQELDDHTAILSHLKNITDLEIKSMIYSKVITALDNQIDTTIEVDEPFKISDKVAITDVLRIIAILFDNAINAAKESPTPKINFSLFSKEHTQYIIIQNSTKEEKIDLHLLSGRFHGNLTNRHSLGLRNLRIILAGYPFIQHNSQSTNYQVTQEIIVHN
ncbi:GHKL domain-containing protein [Lactobacillus sp. Marseille-P7033]|nr:GHKL domain-containing protein [Lactobacillus sp. Marseille-P7033]NGC77637.1 GHKL domain-containing protein [Limosilactobacillus reuteri]